MGLCGKRYFHSIIPGKPWVASALDNAIISASGVDLETHVCRCDNPAIGNDVCGPRRHRCAPDVDRCVSGSPARSASAKRCG